MPYQWVDPNGKRVMLPKSNGASIMLSAFQSRDDGFGVDVTVEEMREINRQRAGQHYPEEAHEANGTTLKPELKASPFIIQFPFGQGNYWTGNHMVLQTVDVIDCLKVIRPDCE
jgi:hypothetical protein